LVFGHFEFGLDGSEARFDEGVVIAVVGAAHALADRGAAEHGPVAMTGVLAAAIAVMNQTGRRLSGTDRLVQGLENDGLAHLLGEGPSR